MPTITPMIMRLFVRSCCFVAVTLLLTTRPIVAQSLVDDMKLTLAYNASGQQLFQKFAEGSGNIVFSPYSIGTAIAMALAGARGETETEMLQVLQHRLPQSGIAQANADVMAILKGYDKSAITCPSGMSFTGTQCEGEKLARGCPPPFKMEGNKCVGLPPKLPSATLVSANALILASGDTVTKQYAALLKNNFAAEIFSTSKVSDINGWVSQQTRGKIEQIIDPSSPIPASTLLNAVYFKARWSSVFKASATSNDTFHVTSMQNVSVPTMHQASTFTVESGAGYRAILMPYSTERPRSLGMVIVLPDQIDGLAAVSAKIDVQELQTLFAALNASDGKRVELALPKFKSSFTVQAKTSFQQLGMNKPFDQHSADFSGMTGHPPTEQPWFISQIIHRALIEVAEDGTEAAAATAVAGVKAAVAPSKSLAFHVDRPFLFYVIDNKTGAILFQGRVVDPSQS